MLRAVEVHQHAGHGANGISVTAHHHHRETHVVVEGDVARRDAHVKGEVLRIRALEVEVFDALDLAQYKLDVGDTDL